MATCASPLQHGDGETGDDEAAMLRAQLAELTRTFYRERQEWNEEKRRLAAQSGSAFTCPASGSFGSVVAIDSRAHAGPPGSSEVLGSFARNSSIAGKARQLALARMLHGQRRGREPRRALCANTPLVSQHHARAPTETFSPPQ